AAFMPWLTGTAFLHSVMIQERRRMLKLWNISLVILTFSLTLFGTFLTRSGVIASVHAFTQGSIGIMFLSFLALVVLVALGLLAWRWDALKAQGELDSVVSRESAFLLNNVMLVAAAFTVFFGTVFPLLSEAVRGVKVKAAATSSTLLSRKADSRETTESSAPCAPSVSHRQAISASEVSTTSARKLRKKTPMAPCVKACTEAMMPERVRNVPNSVRLKVRITSAR